MNPGYVTVPEADAIILDSSEWDDASDTEKSDALSWGRVYIDANYNLSPVVPDSEDETNLKHANALLGDEKLKGTLFTVSETANQTIVEKSVKAGTVVSSKKYSGGSTTIDPFPEVTALLAGFATMTSSTISNIWLLRS